MESGMEKQINALVEHVKRIEQMSLNLKCRLEELTNTKSNSVNKDGLPIGIDIHADVEDTGEVVLRVLPSKYKVKKIGDLDIISQGKEFSSLSAAAEFFSKIKRKSGWVYWRNDEGRTLKDAYKR